MELMLVGAALLYSIVSSSHIFQIDTFSFTDGDTIQYSTSRYSCLLHCRVGA